MSETMRTMWTAQAVDVSRLQGPELSEHLRKVAEFTAAEQYNCEVVGDELERSIRDYWTVPGDLAHTGQKIVCSRWEVHQQPTASTALAVAAWMSGGVFIGGAEVPE